MRTASLDWSNSRPAEKSKAALRRRQIQAWEFPQSKIPRAKVQYQSNLRRPPEPAAMPRCARDSRLVLHGRDDAAMCAPSLQRLRRTPLPVPRLAQSQSRVPIAPHAWRPVPAPPPEFSLKHPSLLERPPSRRQAHSPRLAHHRKNVAAAVRVPGLFPYWGRLRPSCGASSARSSICAYSLLVAHQRALRQSGPRAILGSGHRAP